MEVRDSEIPPDVCYRIDDDNAYPMGTAAYLKFVNANFTIDDSLKAKYKGQCIRIAVYIDRNGNPKKYKFENTVADCDRCNNEALHTVKKIAKWKAPKSVHEKGKRYYIPVFYDIKVTL